MIPATRISPNSDPFHVQPVQPVEHVTRLVQCVWMQGIDRRAHRCCQGKRAKQEKERDIERDAHCRISWWVVVSTSRLDLMRVTSRAFIHRIGVLFILFYLRNLSVIMRIALNKIGFPRRIDMAVATSMQEKCGGATCNSHGDYPWSYDETVGFYLSIVTFQLIYQLRCKWYSSIFDVCSIIVR